MHTKHVAVAAAVALIGGALLAGPAPDARAAGTEVRGTLQTVAAGGMPGGWDGWQLEASVTGSGTDATTAADAAGGFALDIEVPVPDDGILSLVARAPADAAHPAAPTAVLAAAYPGLPGQEVVLNERTTVATAWAMAQFVSDSGIDGAAPGLRNAAGMAANLADPETGAVADALAERPNGDETSTLAAFGSITAALASCVVDPFGAPGPHPLGTCATIIDIGGEADDPAVPTDVFRALAEIARNPGVADPLRLFELSTLVPLAGRDPAVLDVPPVAWTLAVRFDGDGRSLDGPGNFAIDHEGNLWVNNNYQYRPQPKAPACGSDALFRFSPTGEFEKYTGGGLSGAGYGIELDERTGNVWVSNFGFSAPEPFCTKKRQPPHDTASLFTPEGVALSGDDGFDEGELDWPQGMEIDSHRSVWFANCHSGTLTLYPGGDRSQARAIPYSETQLEQAFDVVDNGSAVFASGMVSSSVQMFDYDGNLLPGSPGADPAFANPMGLATDGVGNVWAANSYLVELPCPTAPRTGDDEIFLGGVLDSEFDAQGVYMGVGPDPYLGSVAMIAPDGSAVTQYQGGGTTLPWGITTDGDGNVWVANFAGKRLSAFCGADASSCPPGIGTGDPISPDLTGFYFDGLVRNTGAAVDQSGNVWVANNWLEVPIQTNPGGHEIVAFLGLAAPVAIPAPDLAGAD